MEKEKISEQLVDKLCSRFKNSQSNYYYKDRKEWYNTAFCLTLIPYNEKGVRKMLEHFDGSYRDKLVDEKVMKYF